LLCNGAVNTSKYIYAAKNPDVTIEVLLETMFLLGSCKGVIMRTTEARIVQ
jgi:hypothetical protein